ncbi:MAG: DNA-3-methyladenine glycosylase 2 family protein [Anaerolineales bacterium]|nr:DNA-3-methyladenine glycosylase 2 family protein [Anaerolineales bacterium]
MLLTLNAQFPFSLSAVIRSHGWVQLAPFIRAEGDDSFAYIARLASGKVIEMHVQPAPNGASVETGNTLELAEQDEVEAIITWMLNLERDFSDFYTLASQEPKLAHIVEQAQGRILRSPSLFEDTVKTILTTNTAWGGTIRMVQALVSGFGSPLDSGSERRAFPTPEQIAASDEPTLRTISRLGYRAPYVLGLARALAEGQLDLEAFKTSALPTLELRKRLLAVKGVGGYAAANLLMILGRYDYLPIDSWALKVVSHEWYNGETIGPAEVEAAFERWGEWKGLAYWFWDWSYLK